MNGNLTIPEIEDQILSAEKEFTIFCSSLTDEQFFYQPEGKWSPAQQVKHLVTATNMARLPFVLPGFIVRMIAGKPNRNSRTYEELVAKYKMKLEQGGQAGGRYVPKPVPATYGKEKMLNNFAKAMSKFSHSLKNIREETKLEKYIAPHPLLGKITLRELSYFTIYHTQHHLQNIQKLTEKT
jgi:DinB superfamily